MATANLSVESKDFTLPVVEATAGADGIVVSTLRNDGWVTLDPGFLTTAQCESKITYIDGKNSILRYRGYPIEQLCEQSDFLEVAWLLRHGELPNQEQYDRFISDINHRTMVGEDFRTFMGSFPRTAHPMSVMASAVNALATFYPDTTDINDSDQLDEAATIIMAKARTIVSYIFRRRRDEPMLYPDYSRGYVDDFLRMCFAVPYEPFDSATELEKIALNDEYFVSRHLYPNVDFYTGLIYRAIGFDPSMFTTLFALGRIPGWIAQYREMLADPNTKIGRPRQVYTGYTERDYVPIDRR